MGKKRKTTRAATVPAVSTEDGGDSRKRIRTFADVADSDDEFHLNRDKILLDEEPAAKRRRKIQEEETFLEQSEEEILGHSASDDEVLGQSDPDLEDDSNEDMQGQEDEEEDEGWGASRGDIYGADAIETEEQALEEEAEARRLQKKQLQSMSAADYGFDEDEWKESSAMNKPSVITETLPEPEIPADASPADRLKLLNIKYPEFDPLSRELLELNATVLALSKVITHDITEKPRARAKYNAASAYLGALTMYFALLTSNASIKSGYKAMPPTELRDHGIMAALVDCRAVWARARLLPDDKVSINGVSGIAVDEDEGSADEQVTEALPSKAERKVAKSRKDRHADALQTAKQARIAVNLKRTEAENAKLDALLATAVKKVSGPEEAYYSDNGTDLGEEAPLTAAQAEEKAKRRKSLRFYTSQIAQKANKRGAAGRTAGGDDDIPHRERLRERQARLNAEAEKRGKKHADAGDDLGGESDAEDADEARKLRQEVDQDDDYYDMVAAKTAKKKSDKIAYGEAQKRAAEQGGVIVPAETVGTDGKRKITYAIEKNKGLTPHRKKEARNPRVKKRKKFEEKSKKLATMKATYKGGEGRGGYGGELTGIKANLVKSVKL